MANLDLDKVPAEVRAAIDAYVAKRLAEVAPASEGEKERTPDEQLDDAVAAYDRAENSERRHVGDHSAVIGALADVVKKHIAVTRNGNAKNSEDNV